MQISWDFSPIKPLEDLQSISFLPFHSKNTPVKYKLHSAFRWIQFLFMCFTWSFDQESCWPNSSRVCSPSLAWGKYFRRRTNRNYQNSGTFWNCNIIATFSDLLSKLCILLSQIVIVAWHLPKQGHIILSSNDQLFCQRQQGRKHWKRPEEINFLFSSCKAFFVNNSRLLRFFVCWEYL